MKRSIVAVLLGLVVAAGILPATATPSALGTSSTAAATARWSLVVSSGPATSTTTGPVTASTLLSPTYYSVTNNGTAPLTAGGRVVLKIMVSGTNGALTVLESCSGTWNETANTCSGTTAMLLSGTSTYTLPAGTSFPVGASVRLRLTPLNLIAGGTVTLGASATS